MFKRLFGSDLHKILVPASCNIERWGLYWGYFHEDELAGICGFYAFDGISGLLLCAKVLKPFRNQGIHKKMIQHRIDFAKEKGFSRLYVNVHRNNKPSLSNISRFGFEMVGYVPGVTGIDCDAYTLVIK